MTKTYKVGFWYTEYGTAFVEAESAEDAEKLVQHNLEENGLDNINYKTNDRDYGAQDGEEMPKKMEVI